MGKISITVRIPALDITCDFTVPCNMSVKNAVNLIIRILNSEYGMFDTSDSKVLRPECSFAQLGIFDGARLLLM